MSLSKNSKVRVLENFYALDNVLLNSSVKKENLSENDKAVYEEYQSIKGALLSITIEMYNLVEHAPKQLNEKVDNNTLKEMAQESANIATKNAKKVITSEKGRGFIKEELKEEASNKKKLNIREEVDNKVSEMANKVAIDNLLIARTIYESKNPNKLNEWEGEILEDAYKVLRDSLVNSTNLLNRCQEQS